MAYFEDERSRKVRFLIDAVRNHYTADELVRISQGFWDHRARKLTPFDVFPCITVYATERAGTFSVAYWGDMEKKIFEKFELSAEELGLTPVLPLEHVASSSR